MKPQTIPSRPTFPMDCSSEPRRRMMGTECFPGTCHLLLVTWHLALGTWAARFIAFFLLTAGAAHALERPGVEFKIFQFPADKIPRIDGDPSDWDIVPASYAVGLDQLADSPGGKRPDKKSIDV